MKSHNTSKYSGAAKSITSLRNLRKIKLFPRVNALTVVAYYKSNGQAYNELEGRAYILNFVSLRTHSIALAHNGYSTSDNEEVGSQYGVKEGEIEVDPLRVSKLEYSPLTI